MSNQDLKVWAKNLVQDPVEGNQQRRPITDEEFLEGWPQQLTEITSQQMNQLMFLLSSASAPSYTCAYEYNLSKPIPSNSLELNGQPITQSQAPVLFEHYGNTLPDRTGELPVGWTYIVRLH